MTTVYHLDDKFVRKISTEFADHHANQTLEIKAEINQTMICGCCKSAEGLPVSLAYKAHELFDTHTDFHPGCEQILRDRRK